MGGLKLFASLGASQKSPVGGSASAPLESGSYAWCWLSFYFFLYLWNVCYLVYIDIYIFIASMGREREIKGIDFRMRPDGFKPFLLPYTLRPPSIISFLRFKPNITCN
jgi:hypothetical protein